MSFRRVSSAAHNASSYSSYPANTPQSAPITTTPIQHYQHQSQDQASPTSAQSPSSPSMRKRPRTTLDMHSAPAAPTDGHPPPPQAPAPVVGDDAFIDDQDAADSAGNDDDEEEKPKSDKKAGRRKIKIEFILDKSRRHITFSKRKAGIMKKAYELSTLTGTQVLLLVVSETGLVYTFTTAKLQPLVTQPEGKNLIQACLNAPHGSLPSMPIGTPLGRPSGPMSMAGPPPGPNNLPGGLSIGNTAAGNNVKEDEDDGDNDDATHGGRATAGDKRRRRASSNAGAGPPSAGSARSATSPHSPNSTIPPPPLSIPTGTGQAQTSPASHQPQQPPPPQISLGSPTSPQQQHQQVSASSPAQYSGGSYAHHPSQQHHQQAPQHEAAGMYGSHMISPGGYGYGSGPGSAPAQGGQPPLGSLAAAATQHSHWGPQQPPVGQGSHYGRR